MLKKYAKRVDEAGLNQGYTNRYFLRCLAQKRRASGSTAEWVPYAKALLDTAFVFVGLPVSAILATFVIIGIKYFPQLLVRSYGLAPGFFTGAIPVGSLIVGYYSFRCRFRAYPYDTQADVNFDSEQDRNIVVLQRIVALVSALAMPLISGVIFLLLL